MSGLVRQGGSVQWDGSPLTVRDMRRIMPDCITGFWGDVLYVKTAESLEATVPLGWHVTKVRDGIAVVTEEPVG